jgi:hypothetical protein
MVSQTKDEPRTLWALIGFDTLKKGLPIVQGRGARMKLQGSERLNSNPLPFSFAVLGYTYVPTKYTPKWEVLPHNRRSWRRSFLYGNMPTHDGEG